MAANNPDATRTWETLLLDRLPLYGHRNWIVVVDSAYPAQSNPGIETVVADAHQIQVLQKVMKAISSSTHIHANIYTDKELGFVAESDAPGITLYQQQLDALLAGASVKQLPHEEIITRLDQAAKLFRILIIKTDMTIPYTSVFFELGCGYWDAKAEERLQKAMLTTSI
jgi:L-fucose mutarotase/ribose pyranase (RbsD/FucU family)